MWHRPAGRPLVSFRGDTYEPLQKSNIVLRNGPNDQSFYEYVPRYGRASIRSTAQHPHGHILYDLQAERDRAEDAINARVTSANTIRQERRRLGAERRRRGEGRDGVQEPGDGEQAGPSRHSRSPAPSPSPPPNRRPDDVRRKRPYDPGNDDDNPYSDPSTDPDGGAERVTTRPRKRRRADETSYIWLAREHRWIFSLLDWVRPLPDAPGEEPEMRERKSDRRRGGRNGDGRAPSGVEKAKGDRRSGPHEKPKLGPRPASKVPPPRSPRKTGTGSPRDETQRPGPSNPPDDESSSSSDDNPSDRKQPHIKTPAPPNEAVPSAQPSGSRRRPNRPPNPTVDVPNVQDIPVSSSNQQEVRNQEINPHSLRTPSRPGWGQSQASIDRLLEDLAEWRLDANGQFVDARGRLIADPNSQLINLRGMRANAEGRRVDDQGRLLNSRGQYINRNGQLVDDRGRVPHELFGDLSDNEDYEENYATHPERRPAGETTKKIQRSKGKQPQKPKPLAQGQDQREPPSQKQDEREPPSKEKDEPEPSSQKQDKRVSPIPRQFQQEPPAQPPPEVERQPRAPVRDSGTNTDLHDEPPTARQTPSMVQPTPSNMHNEGDSIDAMQDIETRPRHMLEYERLKKEIERLETERALYRSAAARERQKRVEVEKQLQAERVARDRELDERIEEITRDIDSLEKENEKPGGVVDKGKGKEKAKEEGKERAKVTGKEKAKEKGKEKAKEDETVETSVPLHKPTNSRPKKPTPPSGSMDPPIKPNPNPKKSPSDLQNAGLFDERVDTIKFAKKEPPKKSSPPEQGIARPRAESREESRSGQDELMQNWAEYYRNNPNVPRYMHLPLGTTTLPGAINRPVERGRSRPAERGRSRPAETGRSRPAETGRSRPAERGRSRSRSRRHDPWEESSKDGGRREPPSHSGTGDNPDPLAFLNDPREKTVKGGKSDKLGPLRMSDDEFFKALANGEFDS